MSIFQVGKNFLQKYPKFVSISAKIYYLLNKNKKIIKGNSNSIKTTNSFMNKTKIEVWGNSNRIELGEKCFFTNCRLYIKGNNNNICISNKVFLKDTDIHIEDNGNEIYIGEKTTIFGKTHLACTEGKKILIGKDCMFSTDITFRTGDSHSIVDINGKRINDAQNIIIGNHIWIGNKVILTKGVEICDNSIIGTGSIVTKKFDKNGLLIAGVPAKEIKENVNWLRERI